MNVHFFLPLFFLAVANSLPIFGAVDRPSDDPSDDKELSRQSRIIGGELVPKGEHTFAVIISTYCPYIRVKQNQCSGSVISKKHVLTAAHCLFCDIEETDPKYRYVNKDNIRMMTHGSTHVYTNINRTDYNKAFDTFPHALGDIAIIQLNKEEFDVLPVSLGADVDSSVKTLTALGYGLHDEHLAGGNVVLRDDYKLRKVELPIFEMDDTMMTGGRARKMTYQGDSGGPLIKVANGKVYQVGVASRAAGTESEVLFGDPDDREIIDFFTKVPAYCDYIKNTTGGFAQCENVPW